jgi:dihydroneopterin aldolase
VAKTPLDTIRLKNAAFYAYHGVLSDEQKLGGKFEVDVELRCDLRKGTRSDSLRDTVDYEQVYDCIRSSVLGKKHFLLEGLAGAIITGIFRKFARVKSVTVRVRKPNAPVKGVIDTVEVEMTRERGRV